MPLRVWPGVVIVTLQWVLWFVVPKFNPGASIIGVAGGILGGFAVLIWWKFLSRVRWLECMGALALVAVALFLTPHILHESIRNGMMGWMFVVYSIPIVSLALAVWAVACRRLPDAPRRAALAAVILLRDRCAKKTVRGITSLAIKRRLTGENARG